MGRTAATSQLSLPVILSTHPQGLVIVVFFSFVWMLIVAFYPKSSSLLVSPSLCSSLGHLLIQKRAHFRNRCSLLCFTYDDEKINKKDLRQKTLRLSLYLNNGSQRWHTDTSQTDAEEDLTHKPGRPPAAPPPCFPQLQQNTWGAAPAIAWAACSGSSSTHTSWLLPWLPRQHPQKGGDALEHLALN